MRDEHLVELGRVSGKLDLVIDGQQVTHNKLSELEQRLRLVESRSVKKGGITAAVVSAAINLAVALSSGGQPPKI